MNYHILSEWIIGINNISFSCDPAKVHEILDECLIELETLLRDGVSDEEIEEACQIIENKQLVRLQRRDHWINQLSYQDKEKGDAGKYLYPSIYLSSPLNNNHNNNYNNVSLSTYLSIEKNKKHVYGIAGNREQMILHLKETHKHYLRHLFSLDKFAVSSPSFPPSLRLPLSLFVN